MAAVSGSGLSCHWPDVASGAVSLRMSPAPGSTLRSVLGPEPNASLAVVRGKDRIESLDGAADGSVRFRGMSRLLEDRRQDRMKEINSKVSESARRREDLMKEEKSNDFLFPLFFSR